MSRCTLTNKVLYIEISWIYIQMLCLLLCSVAELLNMAVVHNFEVMLGQTLNHFVWYSVHCAVLYPCKQFILLLLNLIQLFSVGIITA
jgi:hypothetical protein